MTLFPGPMPPHEPHPSKTSSTGRRLGLMLGILGMGMLHTLIFPLAGLVILAAVVVYYPYPETHPPTPVKQSVRLPDLPLQIGKYRRNSVTYRGGPSSNVLDEYTTEIQASYAREGHAERMRVFLYNSESEWIVDDDNQLSPTPQKTKRCVISSDGSAVCQYTSQTRSIVVDQEGAQTMTQAGHVLDQIRVLK